MASGFIQFATELHYDALGRVESISPVNRLPAGHCITHILLYVYMSYTLYIYINRVPYIHHITYMHF